MRARVLVGLAVAAVAVFATAYAADEIKVEGIKCVVAGTKDAKAANAVDYKGGKVFFCCMNCPKAFAADTAKFAAKANHQLVATKQAKQVACPFTGEAVDAATKIKVSGAEVAFCCDMCKGKAEASKDQITLIFAEKGFDKAFKVGEAK
jgi:YHS domain-containing protein